MKPYSLTITYIYSGVYSSQYASLLCLYQLLFNSQQLGSDSVLLSAIEWLTVEVNDGSIASLRTTQLTLTTKLKPGHSHNRPVCVGGGGGGGGGGRRERGQEGGIEREL